MSCEPPADTAQRPCLLRRLADAFCRRAWDPYIVEPFYEAYFGIETRRPIWTVSTDGAAEQSPYMPTKYRTVRRALRGLSIDPHRDVFLDYGCGKGRALVLAARLPFRRVIGIELDDRLSEIARRNLRHARRRLHCQDVDIITTDAAEYQVPPDVTVIYMYNPFRGEILRRVLDRINQSLTTAPRALTLICVNARYLDPLADDLPWMQPQRQFHTDAPYPGRTYHCRKP